MSKASKLHTQCLYEDYSYGTSVGTACATSAAATGSLGVSNDVVIVKVDDDNNDRFKEYEALADSIEDEADVEQYQSNTQRAIPYYVCEQYCSNDPTCYGFVPDYEFGQESTSFSFSSNNDGIVEYDKIRCIIARNASPDTSIMDSTNGLTIPAPCYTKLTDQCIQPNEATIERSAEVCDACHDLTDNCFWCEPHKANFFVASTAQPGKCVCEGEANYLISSTQSSSSMGDSVFERQAKICKMLLPHNDGYPIDLTNGNNVNGEDSNGPTYPSSSGSSSSMQMSYYNETTTNLTSIINTQARSCQAAIEQFRGGSASSNGSNGTQTIAGVTVSSVIVVAVVVSILIPCCICCCLVYLCCFRNKSGHGHGHGRPPTYGSGGNAGGHHPSAAPVRPPVSSARPTTSNTNVPYGNGGTTTTGRPPHPTSTTTTNNNINNNTNTNTNTNNNPTTTTTTNHHHYYYNNSQTPVEAIPVDVISTGVAASSTSPYNPYYYNSTNGAGDGNDLEDGTMIKPMTYSFSNIEPLPPPSASYEIPTPSATNPNYNNHYNSNNNDDDDENEKDDGAIMVRVVAPCDMDEGFRFGASYQGQQFEIVAPKGGLRAGQEMIVSVPQRRSHTSGGRQRDTTANGGTTTSNNKDDDDNDDDDMLPVARPVVD